MSEGGSDEAIHASLFRMVRTRDAFSDNNDGVDSKVVDGRDKAGHEEKEAGLRLPSLFELRRRVDRFNPTGKSVVFASWPVQPHLQKYSCSLLTQISSLIRAVLSQEEGRCARHGRGAGCGGRESVRRAMAIAGRDEPRERSASVQDDRRLSGRQSRVVLAPVAGVKFVEASRPDRAQTKP
jgi:hypothetical protein